MRSRPSRISFSTLMRVCEALGCSKGKLTAGMDAPEVGGSTEPPLIPPETVAVLDQLAQMREFFHEAWRQAVGDDGRWLEPGHLFEWAWLLTRWGRARNDGQALAAAQRLYEAGKAGVDRTRNVAVDVLWDDLTVRDPMARLWPQTERLRAALLFDDGAEALAAANSLYRYLHVPVRGLWRDKLKADGSWVEEPAPASSFYHIVGAILPLLQRFGSAA